MIIHVNNKTITFNVADLGISLLGRHKGLEHGPEWDRRIPNPASSLAWLVDFTGVTTSSSYVNATLGEILTNCTAGKHPDVYPVLRIPNEDVLDEVLICLHNRNLAVWLQLGNAWRVAGVLDATLRDTLIHVATQEGRGTKDFLTKANITQAGWSNRLTALVRHRLIIRTRKSKTFEYHLPPRVVEPSCSIETSPALFVRSPSGLS